MNPAFSPRKLIAEIAVIALVAVTIGLIWNHKLLYRAWTGTAAPAAPPSGSSAPASAIPPLRRPREGS